MNWLLLPAFNYGWDTSGWTRSKFPPVTRTTLNKKGDDMTVLRTIVLKKIFVTSVAIAVALTISAPPSAIAQAPAAAPAQGGGGAQGGGRGRGGAPLYTPAPSAKDLKAVLFNWGWYMGMLRSTDE